jgi:hypothetical protein
MLYKLTETNGVYDPKPVEFQNLPLEKNLEDMLAFNLLEVFFEDELMPIRQSR